MDKIAITDEKSIEKEWTEQAEKQTAKTLDAFINHVMNDYCHNQRTFCHALSACALAASYAACDSAGFPIGHNSGKITEKKPIDDDDLWEYVNGLTNGNSLTWI